MNNPFDDMSRFSAKLDGAGFLGWAGRQVDPPVTLPFARWDDARRVAPPGWPDRTDDLVTVLKSGAWLIVESETELERFIFHRLGVYALLLAMELGRGAEDGKEPPVGCVLLNLTGKPREKGLPIVVEGTPLGQTLTLLIVNFRTIDAAAVLEEIAAGVTALVVLTWVPLMAGVTPALVERWKQVAMLQKDAAIRALYRDGALIFADLSKSQIDWRKGLEGWEMQESSYVNSWIDKGEVRGVLKARRYDLMTYIQVKLQDPVPESVRQAIDGTNDPDVLTRWYKAALAAGSLQDLVTEMRR